MKKQQEVNLFLGDEFYSIFTIQSPEEIANYHNRDLFSHRKIFVDASSISEQLKMIGMIQKMSRNLKQVAFVFS
jgi:hypothetical protein